MVARQEGEFTEGIGHARMLPAVHLFPKGERLLQQGPRRVVEAEPAPHPVQSQATLSFAVKEKQETTLRLYNTLGQRVATLYRGSPTAGETQTVRLSATDLTSGTYFVRLQTGDRTRTQRVTVVR